MVISRIQKDLASRGAIVDGTWSPFRRPAEAEVEPKDVKKLELKPVHEKKLLKMIGASGAGGGGKVGSGDGGSDHL